MLLPFLLQLAVPAWAESPWSAPPAPVGWAATEARFVLTIRDGEPVGVQADYQFATPERSSRAFTLVESRVLVTNAPGPVLATPRGLELTLPVDRTAARQSFSGILADFPSGSASFSVLPATRMRVDVDAPGLDVTIDGAVDGWMVPGDRVSVSWQPKAQEAPPVAALLVQGEAATAFRADAKALAIDSVLRWKVLRGEASSFSFDAAGLDELEIEGSNVANFTQSGNIVVVTTKQPVTSLLSVRVRGRVVAGKSERSVPGPQPTGVQRVDRYWTMTKSDEGELIPVRAPASISNQQMPAWAKGIGEGAPLAQWHGNGELRVFPLDAANVQGPDTVITSARYIVAAAKEGRAGLRMTLRVRNERRQFLHVTPPAGWKAIVVRVSNQPVSALSDGNGGLYIPLEKSIETVKGLLSFPVDVEWVGDEAVWERKGHHTFALPAVDAPIQAAEWEVHLPRDYKAFVPEIRGGNFVMTDLRDGAALPEENERLIAKRSADEKVESALSNAVSAYKKNDFETAQMWVDNARSVNSGNEDIEQLQSNLDVLSGKANKADSVATEAVQRRVKELAKAKTSGLVSQQIEIEEKALDAYRSGDLDQAEALYEAAFSVANELERTEQEESTVQKSKIAGASSKLESIRKERGRKVAEAETVSDIVAQSSYGYGSGSASFSGRAGNAGGQYGDDDAAGFGGLGMSGTGQGGGGTAEGLGGLGTRASGRGEASYRTDGMSVADGASVADGEDYEGESTESSGAYYEEDAPAEAVVPEALPPDTGAAEDPVTTTTSVTLSRESLSRVPVGRSYQSVVQAAPGVGAGKAKKMSAPRDDDEAPAKEGKKEAADAKPATATPATSAPARPPAKPAPPESPAPVVAAPAPPPPPPVQASGRGMGSERAKDEMRRSSRSEPAPEAVYAPPLEPSAGAKGLIALGYLDATAVDKISEESDEAYADELVEAHGGAMADFGGDRQGQLGPLVLEESALLVREKDSDNRPNSPSEHRRAPLERRRALEASPSPMALAMPLDGPAVSHTHALVPANQAPTFTIRYKELTPENL